MGSAADTLVRTTEGDKRVGDVQIGDILYDAQDRQTPCIGVAPPATGKLKTIAFQKFDSREWTSFTCTPDYRLTLTTTGTRPCISGKRVIWFTRCGRTSSYIPSSQPHPPDNAPRSSSPLSDSSSMELDKAAQDRFAAIRNSLGSCDCRGLRRVQRCFKSEELAQLALEIFQSDRHHLLDPVIVRDGEKFSMTVEEYERLCCERVKLKHLKLHRAPPAFDPSTASADPQARPLDPNFLGLWLGDGTAATTTIASSDAETAVWLQSYVDRLNSSRPPVDKLYLTKTLSSAAGTVMSNGYVSNRDVFWYRIACPRLGPGKANNPVLDGLRELGLLGNKSGGVPDAYMEADEDTRLKVIAGLIDSDGSYVKSQNRYSFSQMTDGHKKIIYDLHKLATSCGILVSDVRRRMKPNPFTPGPPTPEYFIYLGKGSEKFQKHLILPRKRMTLEHTYINHDARPCTVSDAPAGEYRAIQVRGGQFQLVNRLVVHDCELNSWFDSPAQGETDTQTTLSSQQVPSISAPPAPTVSESLSSSSKAASTTQPVQKPQSKSSSKRPPKASTSKSFQKSTPASTKKSWSLRQPLQPKPDSQLDARNSTSVTAMKKTYFDPSENVLVGTERLNTAMVLLGDEERGLIPSDDEDTPDNVMPDPSDEPNRPILTPKNNPSKRRSATPTLSATKPPRNGTKITTPLSSSSATTTPDVTITTAETTIIESEIHPERIEQVPPTLPAPTTCAMPVLPPEPAITGPAPIEITNYDSRKRKISVVDEPLNPKY